MINYNPINVARIAYDSIKKSTYTKKLGLGLCSALALTSIGCGKKGSKDKSGLEIRIQSTGTSTSEQVKVNHSAINILIDGEEGEIPVVEMDGVRYGVFKEGDKLILMKDPTQFTVNGKKVTLTGQKPYELKEVVTPPTK